MANFYSFYPPAGSGVANPSVGINGAVAPTSSTEVGGINPGGNLQPLQTDASGNLLVSVASEPGAPFHVIVDSSALPTGASTSANQTTEIGLLTSIQAYVQESAGDLNDIDASTASLDSKTVHVDTGNVTITSSALPTGASTSALQTTGNTSLATIANIVGPSSAGAPALNSALVSATFNSAPITLANGQSLPLQLDAAGSLKTTGTGTAGTPTTGVLTVQGIGGGTAVPVSGTVTATNAANGTPGSAAPAQATQVAGTDGTNLRALSTTAGGVLNVSTAGQTIGVTQSTIPWADNISQFGGNPTVTGTGVSGLGIPRVTVSSDSFPATQAVSGTVTANAGTNLNTSALALDTTVAKLTLSQGSTTSGETGPLVQGAVTTAAPTYTAGQTSPLSLDTSGNLRVSASVTSTVPIASTATLTNVSGSASSVSLLASNASRKQATFFNDSTATLYLKFGTTASTTSYTVQLPTLAYYEMPSLAIYTGAIDGIWSAANGAVRITEMT